LKVIITKPEEKEEVTLKMTIAAEAKETKSKKHNQIGGFSQNSRRQGEERRRGSSRKEKQTSSMALFSKYLY